MEEKNEEQVGATEKAEKTAIKSSENAAANALELEQQVSEKNIKFDEATAAQKKSVDVYEAEKRAVEGAEKAHTLAKEESAVKSTKIAKQDAEADQRHAMFMEKDAKNKVKAATQDKESIVTKEAMGKKENVDAQNDKMAAREDAQVAQRTQEKGSKVAERFRTLAAAVEEREEKRKASALSVAEDEKNFKLASDEAAAESAKCKKLKDANANVGKAYEELKQQMAEWSNKNPWLKQEEAEGTDDSDGVDPDPDIGASIGDDIYSSTEEPYVPPYAKRSFLELLQEDYGTDVKSLLRSAR